MDRELKGIISQIFKTTVFAVSLTWAAMILIAVTKWAYFYLRG